MALPYRVAVLFLVASPCFVLSRVRWPQVVLPFFFTKKSGFCIRSDEPLRFFEHSLRRSMVASHRAFTVELNDQSLMLSGKKIIHTDMTIHCSRLMINDYPCLSVHCVANNAGMNLYVLVSAGELKKNIRKHQSEKLMPLGGLVESWRAIHKSVTLNLRDAFAVIAEKKPMVVRVLLSEASKKSATEWVLKAPDGFQICLYGDGRVAHKKVSADCLTIIVKKGVLFCNGCKVSHSLRLEPLGGYGECNGVVYDGYFSFVPYKNSFLCINSVDLEDYVIAVLRTESWPGWPLEVNKVFAISCRSYVYFQAFEAKNSKRPFHVRNTNAHQTYCGRHDVEVLKNAVNQTRGIVLGFNKKPILAMFDCCCGGIIPAHIDDFDFKKAPYLARDYACNYCQNSSLYSWVVTYENAVFGELIKQYKKELVILNDISVIKKDRAGLVSEVRLKGRKKNVIISGKKIYSLLKDVKSFHFDMKKKNKTIVFTGRGFGHHIGLCQWGARQMVRDGWDYKSILQFYYPQTQFMKII